MSFYIIVYSSLGMSAFWEIHEKVVNICEICVFFLGRALGVDLGSISGGFGDQFGSMWYPKSRKRRSRNSNKKSVKKSHASQEKKSRWGPPPGASRRRAQAGGPLNNSKDTPVHTHHRAQ